jgi:hypothetical protein
MEFEQLIKQYSGSYSLNRQHAEIGCGRQQAPGLMTFKEPPFKKKKKPKKGPKCKANQECNHKVAVKNRKPALKKKKKKKGTGAKKATRVKKRATKKNPNKRLNRRTVKKVLDSLTI